MTQVYKYRAEVGSNWKLFIDAFAEFYHAPVLHAKQATDEESRKLQGYGYEALAYEIDGPHSMVSSWGGMSPPKDPSMVKPIERVLRSGLFGPWDAPDIGLDELPPGLNPARHPAWGIDSFVFFPNFMLLVWEPGWYLTYHYWPTSYNTPHLRGHALLRAAEERRRAAAAGAGRGHVQGVRPAGRQHPRGDPVDDRVAGGHAVPAERPGDPAAPPAHRRPGATSPSTRQQRRDAGRHLGRVLSEETPMTTDPPRRVRRPRAVRRLVPRAPRRERYAKRLASSMDEMQAFYDAAFPRLEAATAYLDAFALDDLPDGRRAPAVLCYSLVNVSFPVEVWRQPRVPDSGAASMDVVVEPAV